MNSLPLFLLSVIFYQFSFCSCINELICDEVEDYFCAVREANLTIDDPNFTIISNVSEVITHVGFRDSIIPILTGDVCRDLKNLKSIIAYGTGIKSIASETFKSCHGLIELEIWSNEIEVLPAFTFQHLLSLRKLNLNYNNIKDIHSKAFDRLDKLEELELRSNDLTYISVKVFEPLTSIKKLDLAENKLIDLNIEHILYHNPSLTEIAIYDNYFECGRQSEMLKLINGTGVRLGKPLVSWGVESKCKDSQKHEELAEPYLGYKYPVVQNREDDIILFAIRVF